MAADTDVTASGRTVGFAAGVDLLSRLMRHAIIVVAALIWIAFWGLVLRLHVQTGDWPSTAVTGGIFVLPAVLGLSYYLASLVPGDRFGR